MRDAVCVQFMQWALPRLRMRWPGFRKVRRQVCKRIQQRINALQLTDAADYRGYLQVHPAEWDVLDGLFRITISRFYRDKRAFDFLAEEVLPALVRLAAARGDSMIKCWSAGCGCGEEPYTLALIWYFYAPSAGQSADIAITATDIDPRLLARAERACYPGSSVRALPDRWLSLAFDRTGGQYCLRPALRNSVSFMAQDIRQTRPGDPFDLILCRNLVFTYFDRERQRQILAQLNERLRPGGALMIGSHETLPDGVTGLCSRCAHVPIYRKTVEHRAG